MYGDCAQFEFSLSVRFELDDSKKFACEGPALPPSLNGVNYINQKTGYLHLAEDYVVDFVQHTFFEIKTTTYFKAAAKPLGTWWGFAISLYEEVANGADPGYYVIADNTIFRQLQPGNYSIFISAFSLEDDEYCPEGTTNSSSYSLSFPRIGHAHRVSYHVLQCISAIGVGAHSQVALGQPAEPGQ
jgi:hypothetical protein